MADVDHALSSSPEDSVAPRPQVKKGWFHTDGRLGDRTIDEQLIGLGPLLAEASGKTVLDVGCAEGLIAFELAKAGATMVRGIEIIVRHLKVAERLKAGLPCEFAVGDANIYNPAVNFEREYDIVLLLAILHKLQNPVGACRCLATAAKSLCVIRLPPTGPIIVDQRSAYETHDIGQVMTEIGFRLEQVTVGPFSEWCGYFRRET